MTAISPSSYITARAALPPAYQMNPNLSSSSEQSATNERRRAERTARRASRRTRSTPGIQAASHASNRAIAIAGNDPDDLAAVATFVDTLGFDPVVAGPLAEGVRMEPGTELFGANEDARVIREMLERFPASERGRARARSQVPPAATETSIALD